MKPPLLSVVRARWTTRCSIRPFLLLIPLVLSTSACAQQPEPPARTGPREIPGGVELEGKLRREICERSFQIGDTVSADIVPSVYTDVRHWPTEFIAVLRRVAPDSGESGSSVHLALVSAMIERQSVKVPFGRFASDIESASPNPGRLGGYCYVAGASLHGAIAKPIRVP